MKKNYYFYIFMCRTTNENEDIMCEVGMPERITRLEDIEKARQAIQTELVKTNMTMKVNLRDAPFFLREELILEEDEPIVVKIVIN